MQNNVFLFSLIRRNRVYPSWFSDCSWSIDTDRRIISSESAKRCLKSTCPDWNVPLPQFPLCFSMIFPHFLLLPRPTNNPTKYGCIKPLWVLSPWLDVSCIKISYLKLTVCYADSFFLTSCLLLVVILVYDLWCPGDIIIKTHGNANFYKF